jgi:cytochrome oxidase assembly protein ShyY1
MTSKTIVIGKIQFRFNWLVAICIFLTVAGLTRLGLWQLDRAAEKTQLQNNFAHMQQIAPTSIENIAIAGLETDAIRLQNRQVALTGEYLNERSLYVIYQPHAEQIGYEIVTPFKPVSDDLLVLVSRGWTAAVPYAALTEKLPDIIGERRLTGQIYVPGPSMATKLNNIKEIKWPLLIRYLNIAELGPLFDLPVFPYVIRLNEGQPGVLVRHWPAVMVDTGRNISYALQWFAMAIAVIIVSLILSSNILNLPRT